MHLFKDRTKFTKIAAIFLFLLMVLAVFVLNENLYIFDTTQQSTQVPAPSQSSQAPAQTQTSQAPAPSQSSQAPAQTQPVQTPTQTQLTQAPTPSQSSQAPVQTQSAQTPVLTQSAQSPALSQPPITADDSNQLNMPVMEPTPVPAVSDANSQEVVSEPSPTPAPDSSSRTLVVIDPGHGGIDPGTVSLYKKGFYEKDIVLDISLKLKTLLEGSEVQVLMTRDTDTVIYKRKPYNSDEDVRERPRIANENNATLFVSIHVNSFDTTIKNGDKHNGTEVYYSEKTFGEFTNKQFAEIMGNAISKKVDTQYRGINQKAFGVLRLSNNPALLIETAFLSNREDHKRLESDDFRMNMAQGIHDGIIEMLISMGACKK